MILPLSVAAHRSKNPLGFYILLAVVGLMWSIFPGFFAALGRYMQPEWKARFFTPRFYRIAGLVQLAIAIIGLLVLEYSSIDW